MGWKRSSGGKRRKSRKRRKTGGNRFTGLRKPYKSTKSKAKEAAPKKAVPSPYAEDGRDATCQKGYDRRKCPGGNKTQCIADTEHPYDHCWLLPGEARSISNCAKYKHCRESMCNPDGARTSEDINKRVKKYGYSDVDVNSTMYVSAYTPKESRCVGAICKYV